MENQSFIPENIYHSKIDEIVDSRKKFIVSDVALVPEIIFDQKN